VTENDIVRTDAASPRRSRRLGLVMAVVAGLASVPAQAGVVGDHGALRVSGNRILNAAGKPIQLAGMSLFWPQWEGNQYFTKEAVNLLANEWGSSLVRAPMPVYTANANPKFQYDAKYIEDVKRVVQAAIDADIYVIVDWHLEGDFPQIELAKQFFGDMARTYGKHPNVIFEIWNEPVFFKGHDGWTNESYHGWTEIRNYAKELLGVIRPHSSNLVIVGSGVWSSNIADPMNDPIDDPNVAYTLHFYACFWDGNGNPAGRDWAAQVSRKIPLFATEWGTTKNDGTGKICLDESDKWLAMFKANGISWAAWSFSHQGGLSAALNKGQGLNSLTENGVYLKRKIQEVGAGLRKPDTVALPGRITAVKYASASAELKSEPTTDAGGGWGLGYSTNGSWAAYTAKVARAGVYELQARVATANSGRLAFSWKGKPLGAIEVGNTGGWQSWTTKTLEVRLDEVGTGTFRVDWSGTAQGLVNLNWMDLVAKSTAVEPTFRDPDFRAVATSTGITVEHPSGTDRIVVTGLDGAVLAEKEVGGAGKAVLEVAAKGMLVVRFEGPRGVVVRPLVRGLR
jgi:endoglucanase